MSITTVSSRKFNQDVSQIKKEASKGPVFITDRGRPAHVLLTIKDYQELVENQENIVELLSMPEASDIDFEPPRLKKSLYRPEEF